MLDTSIHVKTESFDGPLGLLLLLIQKEEMDIRSLDINEITKQYIEYLDRMQELNFDVAGDYLYMAATLVFLKSKTCVSEDDVKAITGEDLEAGLHIATQEELIKRLQELKLYQLMGEELWNLDKLGHEVFTKPRVNRKEMIKTVVNPMDLQELTGVMIDLIRRDRRKYKVQKRDKLSIKEKLSFLKLFLQEGLHTNFYDLLQKDRKKDHTERDNTVITFISLLELARLHKVSIYQNEEYGNIYIDVNESLNNFDVELADGFGPEEETAVQAPVH